MITTFFSWLCRHDHWTRKPIWVITCPFYFAAVIVSQKKDYDWIAFTRFEYWDFNWKLFWAVYEGYLLDKDPQKGD